MREPAWGWAAASRPFSGRSQRFSRGPAPLAAAAPGPGRTFPPRGDAAAACSLRPGRPQPCARLRVAAGPVVPRAPLRSAGHSPEPLTPPGSAFGVSTFAPFLPPPPRIACFSSLIVAFLPVFRLFLPWRICDQEPWPRPLPRPGGCREARP